MNTETNIVNWTPATFEKVTLDHATNHLFQKLSKREIYVERFLRGETMSFLQFKGLLVSIS